ncbi:hypothetical protein [Thiomicrorhabdus indica]|uniref:hypothetical protein n=1 Tax=Thiomicrorhabdus indica TaxID=2267253 RepID=UPI002AA70AAA|nr:hypothetical protein [Thiomicrorhabdus indica]
MATLDKILEWDTSFSLMGNANIVKAWLKAMAITYLLIMLILTPMFVGTGESESIPVMAGIFLAVCTGLAMFGFVIMLLVMGNRSQAHFELSDDGVIYQSTDNTSKTLSRIAVLAGGFFGSAQTAGAGLLSISNETIQLPWQAIHKADYDENNLTIRLCNAYRELLHLYCTPENFEQVKKTVQEQLQNRPEQEIQQNTSAGKRPFYTGILLTCGVLLACLPLFALNDLFDLPVFSSLLIMLFSLATVWLIPLFAWVVLVLELFTLGWIVMKLLESSTLQLVNTYTFLGYELLDAGEWILLMIAIIGMAFLSWICLNASKGKLIPLLIRDRMATED